MMLVLNQKLLIIFIPIDKKIVRCQNILKNILDIDCKNIQNIKILVLRVVKLH